MFGYPAPCARGNCECDPSMPIVHRSTIYKHTLSLYASGPVGLRTHKGHGGKSGSNLPPKRFQFENNWFDVNPM